MTTRNGIKEKDVCDQKKERKKRSNQKILRGMKEITLTEQDKVIDKDNKNDN